MLGGVASAFGVVLDLAVALEHKDPMDFLVHLLQDMGVEVGQAGKVDLVDRAGLVGLVGRVGLVGLVGLVDYRAFGNHESFLMDLVVGWAEDLHLANSFEEHIVSCNESYCDNLLFLTVIALAAHVDEMKDHNHS